MRSGYRPAPRYAVTVRLEKRRRERRILDLVGSEASAAAAARFLSEVLGELPVEHSRQRDRGELPAWGYGALLVGVLGFIVLLVIAATSEGP